MVCSSIKTFSPSRPKDEVKFPWISKRLVRPGYTVLLGKTAGTGVIVWLLIVELSTVVF
jgi:hypothetical protein